MVVRCRRKRIPRVVVVYAAAAVISLIYLLHQEDWEKPRYDKVNNEPLILGEPMPLQKASDIVKSSSDRHKIRIKLRLMSIPPHGSRVIFCIFAQCCNCAVIITKRPQIILPHCAIVIATTNNPGRWSKADSQGFLWAYDRIEDWDWVVKVDDDSFLLVENLRKALVGLDTQTPVATGMQFTAGPSNDVYLQGGSGYVLSRGAVTQLVERGLHEHVCKRLHLGTSEDVNMGRCLKYLGVQFLDSRDSKGHQRFHVLPPQELLDPRRAKRWRHFWQSRYPINFGLANMSKKVISFHQVDADSMYLIYYLIYYLNPLQTDGHEEVLSFQQS
ncbi:unnamed protein product, partial [Meganyctiphanes norvegica]